MTDFDCDVLIAGGGPTGVTLAVLLARRGVKVIVAEKEADIYPLPRAAHIDHECLRILQEAGIVDEVMSGSRRASRYDFLNAKGDVLLRFRAWWLADREHDPPALGRSRAAPFSLRFFQCPIAGPVGAEILCGRWRGNNGANRDNRWRERNPRTLSGRRRWCAFTGARGFGNYI